jgi:hypothetical protein
MEYFLIERMRGTVQYRYFLIEMVRWIYCSYILKNRRRKKAGTFSLTGKRNSWYLIINREEGQQVLPHKQGRVTAGTSS